MLRTNECGIKKVFPLLTFFRKGGKLLNLLELHIYIKYFKGTKDSEGKNSRIKSNSISTRMKGIRPRTKVPICMLPMPHTTYSTVPTGG